MRLLCWTTFISLLLASCDTARFIQHTPTLANTGQHTDEGQLHGKVLYSSGSSSVNSVDLNSTDNPYQLIQGLQLQGSYSFRKKMAFQLSHMYSAEKGGSDISGQKTVIYRYKRNVTEAGISFFDNIDPQQHLFVELAGGLGFGKYNATEISSLLAPGGRFYDHNVFKVYLQPAMYATSKNFGLALGFKFSSVNFGNISTNYSSDERTDRFITTASSLHTTTMDYFMKGNLFLNKLPWLGLNAEFLWSTDLGKNFSGAQNDWNTGIGLAFRFDYLSKKK